jgi:hypothetical protein
MITLVLLYLKVLCQETECTCGHGVVRHAAPDRFARTRSCTFLSDVYNSIIGSASLTTLSSSYSRVTLPADTLVCSYKCTQLTCDSTVYCTYVYAQQQGHEHTILDQGTVAGGPELANTC